MPSHWDATSEAVVVKPVINLLRTFLTCAKIYRRRLRPPCDADRGGNPGSLWIPVANLRPKSPNAQAPAPRVFHLNLHPLAPRIFYLDGYAPEPYALEQALAPGVFHLNYHAPEQATASRVFHLNRRDFAPRVFHLNHHAVRQALAPDSFVSRLKSGWRDLRNAGCPILADQANFVRWGKHVASRSCALVIDRAGPHSAATCVPGCGRRSR
jgi:hypothetical protein